MDKENFIIKPCLDPLKSMSIQDLFTGRRKTRKELRESNISLFFYQKEDI